MSVPVADVCPVRPRDAVEAMRRVCRELVAGALEVPARLSLDEGRLLVMSARHATTETAVTKVVTIGPSAGPRIGGRVLWTAADGNTDCLAPAGSFTALRTAAVTALAVDLLTRSDVERLVVVGAGPQAEMHARVLVEVRPISSVTIVGRGMARALSLRDRLASGLEARGVGVSVSSDLRESLGAADVVCCATTATVPLFDAAWVPRDTFVSAVGSHRRDVRELPRELFASASAVVVDDVAACMVEAGEIFDATDAEVLRAVDLRALPALWAEHQRGVRRAVGGGPIVFKSVGTAAYDWGLAEVLAAQLVSDGGGSLTI